MSAMVQIYEVYSYFSKNTYITNTTKNTNIAFMTSTMRQFSQSQTHTHTHTRARARARAYVATGLVARCVEGERGKERFCLCVPIDSSSCYQTMNFVPPALREIVLHMPFGTMRVYNFICPLLRM